MTNYDNLLTNSDNLEYKHISDINNYTEANSQRNTLNNV